MFGPHEVDVRFSEKYGHKKVRDIVQLDSVDELLRNALWSLLKVHVWDKAQHSSSSATWSGYSLSDSGNKEIRTLCERLWLLYFKFALDTLDDDWTKVLPLLRAHFFSCQWYEVYDFVEFVANNYFRYFFKDEFVKQCNVVLQREMSAFRFVDFLITPITGEHEVEEVEQALARAQGPVRIHLRRALELLSDRQAPDYRNSVKESISAVESLVAKTVGEKGTLGQLIKKLENEVKLHPALQKAFSSLYGYTSDEGGIRHALLGSETVIFADAKFFLVVCSAFINYVESQMSPSR